MISVELQCCLKSSATQLNHAVNIFFLTTSLIAIFRRRRRKKRKEERKKFFVQFLKWFCLQLYLKRPPSVVGFYTESLKGSLLEGQTEDNMQVLDKTMCVRQLNYPSIHLFIHLSNMYTKEYIHNVQSEKSFYLFKTTKSQMNQFCS